MVGAGRALVSRARVALLFEYNLPRLLSADFVRALGARPMSPVIVRDGSKVAPPSIQVNVETTRVFPKRVFIRARTERKRFLRILPGPKLDSNSCRGKNLVDLFGRQPTRRSLSGCKACVIPCHCNSRTDVPLQLTHSIRVQRTRVRGGPSWVVT